MRLPLTGKAYQERSGIASALQSINLYAELNTDDSQASSPTTYYLTPGFAPFAQPNNPGKARGEYRTSKGTGYVVIGPTVYNLASNGALVFVGSIPDIQSQVYFADNGLAIVLVDGVAGWAIDINTNQFGPIIDPSFYGADYVVYLDTFFVFNRPATNQFYISLSQPSFAMLIGTAIGTGTITAAGAAYTNGTYQSVPLTGGSGTGATADIIVTGNTITGVSIDTPGLGFAVGDILGVDPSTVGGTGAGFAWTVDTFALSFDPLDIAAKTGSADPIVGIATTHRDLWLIGALTTEVWIGTGAADFYFQLVQGAYIDHGCIAQYSIASQDIITFWLMRDRQGKNILVQGSNYEVTEISTPKFVELLDDYITTADAIGFCFQISDHAFYCITFPQANKTWLYDLKTQQLCEWNFYNSVDGSLNRHRANCCMFVFEKVLIGDWQTGQIYYLDSDLYTDNGNTILRIKDFCHMVDNFDRVVYNSFDADMEVGTSIQLNETDLAPTVSLLWSDDRGKSFGFPVEQSMGKQGEFQTTISWNRLGYARDRIFRLQWAAPIKTALNGGFVENRKART